MKSYNIGVIGLWHLGCVLCSAWSRLGNKVIGFDYDSDLVNNLQKAIPPIYEPDLTESIQKGLDAGNLSFSNQIQSLSQCDFIFLSYDTPVLDDDSSDTSILLKSVIDAGSIMQDKAVLIVSSQAPVGFCSVLRERLKEQNPTLDLAYSPENLRLGEAIQCYLHPGRIILGTADTDTESKCLHLFSQINTEMICMRLESAEMVKHGINSFLAMSIVFSNHLADICESTGARIDDVVKGMKTDPRIGQKSYLSPGIGFSGGTLGRDLRVLSKENSEANGQAVLFSLIHQLNQERKFSIVNRLERILGTFDGKSIGLLGMTYKPGTSTLRRSLPIEIANLLAIKKAHIKVYDPKADFSELGGNADLRISQTIEEVATGTDVLVLLTEWPDFREYNWASVSRRMKMPIFFDTKNFLDESEMITSGFQYYSIGR